MSERKIPCPLCQRPPGGIHDHACPRSRAFTRQRAAHLKELSRPRVVWTFGEQSVFVPGKGNQITFNPGIPYVDQRRGKPWHAGGKPRRMAEKQRAFIKHLNAKRERAQAQQKGILDGITA